MKIWVHLCYQAITQLNHNKQLRKGFDACTDVDSDQMQFGNDSQDVEILFGDASIEIMGTTHDQKKNYTPSMFVTDCSIHFWASKYERVDNNKLSTFVHYNGQSK